MNTLIESIKNNTYYSNTLKYLRYEINFDIKELCEALKTNSFITFLDLSETHIHAVGIKYLCETLKVNSFITSLDLSCNFIK